jgi:hypothetical protein
LILELNEAGFVDVFYPAKLGEKAETIGLQPDAATHFFMIYKLIVGVVDTLCLLRLKHHRGKDENEQNAAHLPDGL